MAQSKKSPDGGSMLDKIQGWMLSGKKRLVFVIGGAYGFSKDIYNRGN